MKEEKIICIYEIVNIKNDKRYIGSAIDFRRRKRNHLNLLRKQKHHSIKLQNSFNKYGENSFQFNIIEELFEKDKLIEREQYYLGTTKPEFNMTLIAGLNSSFGLKRTKETCKKISDSLLGKRMAEETKELLRQANLGKKQSKETKEKRSKAVRDFHLGIDEPILQFDKNRNFLKEWKNQKEIIIYFNDSGTQRLKDVLNNKLHRKTYKKFIWKRKYLRTSES